MAHGRRYTGATRVGSISRGSFFSDDRPISTGPDLGTTLSRSLAAGPKMPATAIGAARYESLHESVGRLVENRSLGALAVPVDADPVACAPLTFTLPGLNSPLPPRPRLFRRHAHRRRLRHRPALTSTLIRVTLPPPIASLPSHTLELPHAALPTCKNPWTFQGNFALAETGFARRSQSAGRFGNPPRVSITMKLARHP